MIWRKALIICPMDLRWWEDFCGIENNPMDRGIIQQVRLTKRNETHSFARDSAAKFALFSEADPGW
jgi:hypothetical protein